MLCQPVERWRFFARDVSSYTTERVSVFYEGLFGSLRASLVSVFPFDIAVTQTKVFLAV